MKRGTETAFVNGKPFISFCQKCNRIISNDEMRRAVFLFDQWQHDACRKDDDDDKKISKIEFARASDDELLSLRDRAVRHLQYYNSTMVHFSSPEKRHRAYDTEYYESIMPILDEVMRKRGLPLT